jgi:branched-chain amino acid transport system substrate-binding protein
MHPKPGPLRCTRRHFLRAAAVLAGAAALPLAPAAKAAAAGSPPATSQTSRAALRIGVLVPASAGYPQLGPELLAGLRLAFEQTGQSAVLVPQDVGLGVGLVAGAAERLLLEERADLLVAMVNPDVAATLDPLLAERRAVLLNAVTGANVARRDDVSPYVFSHALSSWQASWALGGWAARTLGRRAAVAMSLYDSGFDAHYAFRLGFEEAGGKVLLTHVTHLPLDAPDPAGLVAPLTAQRVDFVYAAYCGQPAVEFVQAYARAGLAGRLPLVGGAFLTDEQLLPAQGPAALGIRTAAPWSGELQLAENQRFVADYQARAGALPSAFALLGYETGRLIAGAMAAAGNPRALRDALASARLDGPRGAVVMNGRTLSTTGPLYLREVRAGNPGVANAVLATLAAPGGLEGQVERIRGTLKTGWIMPYLCG